jgi:hypothetical protein
LRASPNPSALWEDTFLPIWNGKPAFSKYPVKPENGFIALRDDIYGLGLEIDEERVEKKTRIVL